MPGLQPKILPTLLEQGKEWVAVDKPAEWLSVPSRMGAKDPRPCVGLWLQDELKLRIWPVHRLDEEVSGVMLFALSARAHQVLNGAFETGQLHKQYAALSEGSAPAARAPEEWLWESLLLRGKKRTYERPFGKESRTRARWEGEAGGFLRWSLWPLTGRAHQLRFEMAKHASPIVGDALYGAKQSWPHKGIALRARTLDLSQFPEAGVLGLPTALSAPEKFGL